MLLKDHFLKLDDSELLSSPSIILSKVRLLKERGEIEVAYKNLKKYIEKSSNLSEVIKVEYIKILIEIGQHEQAMEQTRSYMENKNASLTRHYCSECGFNSDNTFWRCPQCHQWETIQFRWKV